MAKHPLAPSLVSLLLSPFSHPLSSLLSRPPLSFPPLFLRSPPLSSPPLPPLPSTSLQSSSLVPLSCPLLLCPIGGPASLLPALRNPSFSFFLLYCFFFSGFHRFFWFFV